MPRELRQLIIRVGSPNFGVRYAVGPLGSLAPFFINPPQEIPSRYSERLFDLSQIRHKSEADVREIRAMAAKLLQDCVDISAIVIALGSQSFCESR